jgi:hypothetical protein
MLRFFHSTSKRQAMVCLLLHSFYVFSLGIGQLKAVPMAEKGEESFGHEDGASITYRLSGVQEKRACLQSIARAVLLIEENGGWRLDPMQIPQVAILLDISDSPGLVISPTVIDAVLEFLSFRNYEKKDIFLVGFSKNLFHESGILKNAKFLNYKILHSDVPNYFSPLWYYDSPMPPSASDRAHFFIQNPYDHKVRELEERKSMLPACLFKKGVHWINLAVAKDDRFLAIDGAVSNLSLHSSTNTRRFLEDPLIGSAAAVEILGIPEFWEKRLFSVLDLSTFQVASGSKFDAEFIFREDALLIGQNPLALDYYGIDYLAAKRKILGLKDRRSDELLLFKFGRELGMMDPQLAEIRDL